MSSKKRNIRRRLSSGSSDSDQEAVQSVSSVLGETKELHKLRKRSHGVSSVGLAYGKRYDDKSWKPVEDRDPYKSKTGGFVDMKTLRRRMMADDSEGVVTDFASGSGRGDLDANMLKYVEDELKKRRGEALSPKESTKESFKTFEDRLKAIPDYLKGTIKQSNEEMLSDQILGGIPEVDLGLEAKIRNIEKTEEAKAKLLKERAERQKSAKEISEFVPTNIAVDFVQHNRFNIDEPFSDFRRKPKVKHKEATVGDVEAEEGVEEGIPEDILTRMHSGNDPAMWPQAEKISYMTNQYVTKRDKAGEWLD